MEDTQIVELFLKRDERAIKETEEKYGRLCHRIAENLTGNKEDAEECVNDTYMVVWNKIPPIIPVNFTAFICKIARNLSLKKRELMSAKKRSGMEIVSFSELENDIPDESFAPHLSDESVSKLLSTFLRKEKELKRNVFIRRYWFGDSIGSIAEMYHLSESSVKSMLFRTRNKLKVYLKKEGFDL